MASLYQLPLSPASSGPVPAGPVDPPPYSQPLIQGFAGTAFVYPVSAFGQVWDSGGNPVTDDMSLNQALLQYNSVLLAPNAVYQLKTSVHVPATARLGGPGWGLATIQPGPGFAPDASGGILSVDGPASDIGKFIIAGGASGAYAANPAVTGAIVIQPGAQYTSLHDLAFSAVNGWEISYTGPAAPSTATIIGTVIRTIRGFQTRQGMHFKGGAATGFTGQVKLTDLQHGQLGGDVLFLEDFTDVGIKDHNCSVTPASGAAGLHIKGACAYVNGTGLDLGVFPAGAATGACLLIENSANGSPVNVHLWGEVQSGLYGFQITGAADQIYLYLKSHGNQSHGGLVQGSGDIYILDSTFDANNVSAAANIYDLEWTGTSPVRVSRCLFKTAVGGGGVANPMDFTGAGPGAVTDCECLGTGTTSVNVFGTEPAHTRNVTPYNPHGAAAIAVPATTVPTPARAFDMYFTFTSTGSAGTSIQVSGSAPGPSIPVAIGTTIMVPSGQTLTPTYTGTPPAWSVYGN